MANLVLGKVEKLNVRFGFEVCKSQNPGWNLNITLLFILKIYNFLIKNVFLCFILLQRDVN
jgi:hypothetical protein